MYNDKNLIYFFTILEAIEKINIEDFNLALTDALESEYYNNLEYLKNIK